MAKSPACLLLPFLLALPLVACGSGSSPLEQPPPDSGAPGDTSTTTPGDAPADTAAPPDGGMSDGPVVDAAPPAPITITAPDDTWTWVPIPGAVCGNGSPTGIGVNPHAGATHLLIYLQGGGACIDGTTCWVDMAASNMTGYGATDFASDPTKELGIYQRAAAAGNPWDDADLVFVPYCTGDLHVGTTMTSFTVNGKPTPTYFYGGHNVDLDVASLALTYKGLSHIWLSGISAGGFGSFLNQDSVSHAFSGVPVDVIDDSGPAAQITVGGVNVSVGLLPWGVRLPPGCPTCMNLVDVFSYDRKTYPMSRYAFLTYQTDNVLPTFFMTSDAMFAMEIQSFITSFASDPNAHAFVALSTGHGVMIGQDATANPFILPWLTQMAGGSAMWANEMH